jgi:hypothetical protein
MLNEPAFGNTADVYAIVHLVPHACQHIRVDYIYNCPLAANQDNYVRGLFLTKNVESFSLSISVRITMIYCEVYLLRILKCFTDL